MAGSWQVLVLVASLLLQGLAAEDSCPAGGGPGCGDAGLPEEELVCRSWRQTGGCDPNGRREPHGDKGCNEQVDTGASGYCECGKSRIVKARLVRCGHRPFSCAMECKQLRRYQCVSWRQTGGCSPEGEREPNNDQTCTAEIQPTASGYCECGNGRIIRKPGCTAGQFADSFTCQAECEAEPDLYEDLEVDSAANEKVIKQAFRKLSLKYHPDKTGNDPTAKARFQQIREAFDIISDPEQRGVYDALGMQMVYEAKNQRIEKGGAAHGETQVTLEMLYNGQEYPTSISRKVMCRGCAVRMTPKCHQCTAGCANEIELVNVRMGPMIVQQQQEVQSKEKCRLENVVLPLAIERGMAEGDSVTFRAMGEQQPKKIPGDVILTLKVKKHAVFKRTGMDLHADVEITLKEALLGFKRTLTHLDGRAIEFEVKTITKPGAVMRIAEEGMPQRGDPTTKGNLYIKFKIIMPKDSELTPPLRDYLTSKFPS